MAATSRVRPKEFHFPVRVEWLGERRVAARVEGKPAIEITAPPVFRGRDPTTWSPEDFFVAAAAACLAYTSLTIEGEGVAGKRADGRFGFTRLSLRLAVETDPVDEPQARRLAEQAEQTCLVSASLDLPIETVIESNQLSVP